MKELVSLLPLIAIALVFWLLLVRPAQRQRRELKALQESLRPGDSAVLTCGIHGTLAQVRSDQVDVEIADGVVITVAKAAVGARRSAEPGEQGE